MTKAVIFRPDSGDQWREFAREADHFAEFLGPDAKVIPFPASAPTAERRKLVLRELDARRGTMLEMVAFLCHGYRTGIQAGFDLRTAFDLAQRIRACTVLSASIPLYACSTGKGPGVDQDGQGEATGPGEGGFADTLRDELVAQGMRGGKMLAHYSPGHLARNPETRLFSIEPGASGGYDIAPLAKDRDLYRRWRGLLHTPNGRWEIATMDGPAIEAKARGCEPYTG